MRHTPYQASGPFGPFEADGSPVERRTSNTVDVRGAVDWRTVLAVDCSESSWGQVLITCNALASAAEGATKLEVWPWVEVRIVADVNGQRMILLEAAIGSHNAAVIGNDEKSCGPVFLAFAPGEVPDRLEVHARARKGGLPVTGHVVEDEILDLIATARFHQ
jgi:hypothetical protein